jgi:hypothetical protein
MVSRCSVSLTRNVAARSRRHPHHERCIMTKLQQAFTLIFSALLCCTSARAETATYAPPLNEATLSDLRRLYKQLIEAENMHDLHAVGSMLLTSPVSLFISRTEPVEKGDWGGYWGTAAIMGHFASLYSGTFRIDPDYAEEKVVGLTPDVAETYVPVTITSGYGGQAPVGRRFLMVLEWVRTTDGWLVATDIPLPIPPAPEINR